MTPPLPPPPQKKKSFMYAYAMLQNKKLENHLYELFLVLTRICIVFLFISEDGKPPHYSWY